MQLENGELCKSRAKEVDHIIELADGGSFWQWGNLRALCRSHHREKTTLMRRTRAALKKAEKDSIKERLE
jgi:5-methylcytosine-specific restriction endonuclease McrA